MLRLRTSYLLGDIARLWWVFLLVGLFAISTPFFVDLTVPDGRAYFAGAVAVFMALALVGSHTGKELDLTERRIRDYSVFWGYRFGSWRPLPTISRVVITEKKVRGWNTPNGISPTYQSSTNQITIGLFTDAEQPVDIMVLRKKPLAQDYARQLSDALKAKLVEA